MWIGVGPPEAGKSVWTAETKPSGSTYEGETGKTGNFLKSDIRMIHMRKPVLSWAKPANCNAESA
jgi:hypothetical protein